MKSSTDLNRDAYDQEQGRLNGFPERPGFYMRHYAPVLTLLLLAPLIGEVLFGSTPVSKLPFGLLGQIGLYGGGAVMIRELVRRRGLGSEWIVILGVVYGITEEGLVLQSLFNPHFPGLDFLAWYGRALGVNWIWGRSLWGTTPSSASRCQS